MGENHGVLRYLLACVVALGCGSHSSAPSSTTPVAKDDPACPVLVAGTSVAVEDTTDGAALVFVTTGDVAQVRKRAQAFAHGAMITTKSTATATDVEGGARVTYAAADPKDVAALQSELRMHSQHLSGGTCEMHM